MSGSTPSFGEFYPHIPYQRDVINDVAFAYDYGLGTHEVLLSGSVGSAKSLLMAHIGVRHVTENSRAKLLLGRKSLPDLKETIFRKICEHLEGSFIAGQHYEIVENTATIRFSNGSEIISRSWGDKLYKKMRSLELSAAIIEELTENDDQDKTAYEEIKMRVGRLPHLKKPWIIAATNPDSPGHWVHKHFIESTLATRHVYYSVTTDNPFLPPQYIDQLLRELDPMMALRMIRGLWVVIEASTIYHQYEGFGAKVIDGKPGPSGNVGAGVYKRRRDWSTHLAFDFNIGEGKPLSVCVMEYDRQRDTWHIFGEVVIDGAGTEDAMEELAGRGYLDESGHIIVNGDATGRHRDTRNIKSDYDIIRSFLSNYKTKDGRALSWEMQVPLANPAIRARHNLVNGYCKNAHGERRLFVYRSAPTADEGLRMSALKKGGNYVEDDSKRYQHISTAIGYALCQTHKENQRPEQGTRRL